MRQYNVLSDVTYSPSHRQAGAPTISIQSTLHTAICLKILYSQCYLVATLNSYKVCMYAVRYVCIMYVCGCVRPTSVSMFWRMCACACVCVCVCTHTHSSEHRDAGRSKEIKNGTAVKGACEGKLPKCLFGYACRRFVSHALNGLAGRLPKTRFEPAPFKIRQSNANRYIVTPSHKAAQNIICTGAWK